MTTITTRRGRVLTAAQQEASDARRAAFREIARKIGAMTESERAALAATLPALVTVEGHALSAHNACLVALQRPDATLLGGFNQWRAAGRCVRKGEHGIMVWAPSKRRAAADAGDAADSDTRPGFVPITVFDVGQTDPIEAAA